MTNTTFTNFKMKHRFANLQQSPVTNLGLYEQNEPPSGELKSHLPLTINNIVRMQV
jgi:hypothetical protein